MGTPKVSVLMSVHNGKPYIQEAVDSILSQSLEDLEMIVVENQSDDGTDQVLAGYRDPRLRVIENQDFLTLSQSLNRGLEAARGEFVARLDADDIALSGRLEQQARYLDDHADTALVATNWVPFNDSQELENPKIPKGHVTKAGIHGLPYENAIAHSSIMFRRAKIESIGGYDETYAFAMDYALYISLLKQGEKLGYIDKVLVGLRHHQGQFSAAPDKQLLCAKEMAELYKMSSAVTGGSLDMAAKNRWSQARSWYMIAGAERARGNIGQMIKAAIIGFSISPIQSLSRALGRRGR